jgi:hypothetical protein
MKHALFGLAMLAFSSSNAVAHGGHTPETAISPMAQHVALVTIAVAGPFC